MKDLQILTTQDPIAVRRFSINGEVFEKTYFNQLLFRLKENTLNVNSCSRALISQEKIFAIKLSDGEKQKYQQLCSKDDCLRDYLEELLNERKINDKKIFSVEYFSNFISYEDEFVFSIFIKKNIPQDYVIDLNFILKQLEKVINF